MMRTSLKISLWIALLSAGGTTEGGTIHGTVSAEVKIQTSEGGSAGSYGSRKYKFLEQVDYSKFQDFVVSLDGVEAAPSNGKRPEARVEQKNGIFTPRILPIAAGTEVLWPNRDDIFHNVFSISETRPFDLGYYKSKDNAKSVIFEKPGRVDVFCSIHSQMNCIVLVMPNPWFSPTDKKGNFEIKDVPAGTYRVKAWHERLPPKYVEITVPETGDVELNIVMGLADLPKF